MDEEIIGWIIALLFVYGVYRFIQRVQKVLSSGMQNSIRARMQELQRQQQLQSGRPGQSAAANERINQLLDRLEQLGGTPSVRQAPAQAYPAAVAAPESLEAQLLRETNYHSLEAEPLPAEYAAVESSNPIFDAGSAIDHQYEDEGHSLLTTPDTPASTGARTAAPAAGAAARIRQALRNPASAREAIIAAELLRRPES